VTIGPTSPRRGGIVAHGECLRHELVASGRTVGCVAYRRLYPRWVATEVRRPPQVSEGDLLACLDTMNPASWRRAAEAIAAAGADVLVFELWHPVVLPAVLAVCRRLALLDQGRRPTLLAVIHNAVPHERVPGSHFFLRRVLGQLDGALCYSRGVAERVGELSPELAADRLRVAELGPLLSGDQEACPPELASREFELALGRGQGVVLAPGPERAYKGRAFLAEALRSLPHNRRPRLLLAGPEISRGRKGGTGLFDGLSEDGIFQIKRYLSDEELTWILRRASVLALPYRAASQSGWPALALRFELPLVATAVGGLAAQVLRINSAVEPETQADHGAAPPFVLVDRRDAAGFGEALRRACARPRSRAAALGGAVSEQSQESWQLIVGELEGLSRLGVTGPGSPALQGGGLLP
jgi:D-inositol-3-phosphate glycosyltransferase